MDWSREIQGVNDPAVLKISDAWKDHTLLKRLIILKCINSPQSKDVEDRSCMERNARDGLTKSVAIPERL